MLKKGRRRVKFSFRLQSLLNWKESLEEESRIQLARKRHRLKKQEEELQDLLDRRAEHDRLLRTSLEKGLSAREYQIEKGFAEESYTLLAQMEADRKEVERSVEKERERLIHRRKEKRVLEALKKRRLAAFIEKLKISEQKTLDEMTTGAYGRTIRFIETVERDT